MRRGSQELALATLLAVARAMPADPPANAYALQPAAVTVTVTQWPQYYAPPGGLPSSSSSQAPASSSAPPNSTTSQTSSTPPVYGTASTSSDPVVSSTSRPVNTTVSLDAATATPVNATTSLAPFSNSTSTPTTTTSAPWVSATAGGCGPVSQYFNQTAADWDKANTSAWLDGWWANNVGHFPEHAGGFAASMGGQYLNNPDWTCRTDGSSSNCDLNPCTAVALNNAGKDMQPAYLVLEGVNRIHSYFVGLGNALQASAIGAALSKDEWAVTFYTAKGVVDFTGLRNVLIALNTVVGLAAAIIGPMGVAAAVGGGVAATLFGAGVGFANVNIKPVVDDTFNKAADVGARVAQVFTQSLKDMITGNNQLMAGSDFGGQGDIRTFLKGGAFSQFGGVDQVKLMNVFNSMLVAIAINNLWKQQKVFILGGGPCDDSGGIGAGPQTAKVCRDGKAWYLYFWEENKHFTLRSTKWGWVSPAPGSDKLGQGDYAGISIADVINSSLDAYAVAGYNYTNEIAHDQALKALTDSTQAPGFASPAWQGTFSIPVCDVGAAAAANIHDANYILMPYDGNKARPHWCGPICSNDQTMTDAFIDAAKMKNFKSPRHYC